MAKSHETKTADEPNLSALVGIGGLLTIKQVAEWYRPILNKDTSSKLPPNKRFLAPPQRGLGTVDSMRKEAVERLDRMQDKLDGKKLFLVGHSLGGLMATMVALDRPEMVAGVVSLGGVHQGYKRETPATLALRHALRNPPEGRHLKHDSAFMQEHTARMQDEWPANVPLHIIATPLDVLVVPPQGFNVTIAHGEPEKRLVIPPIPGAESFARRRWNISDDVQMLRSRYATEHINLPRNPDIANYIDMSRRALVTPTLGNLSLAATLSPELAAAA